METINLGGYQMSRTDKIKHLRNLILRTGGELIPLASIEAGFTDSELDKEIEFFEWALQVKFPKEGLF